jgi:uncharacterized integral membrane protein (TIGR00697 family)
LSRKAQTLYIVLCCFFICNAILAEFIGSKIFSLEKTLNIIPINWFLFNNGPLNFDLTAGVLIWPAVFIMTDLINEYFGYRGVRRITIIAAFLIAYSFLVIFISIRVEPANFWEFTVVDNVQLNQNLAFKTIFGQGLWIIFGSIVAFLIGQITDVVVFSKLRKITKKRFIWIRATGSTLISQLIDSFVVLFIAFYLSGKFSLSLVLGIAIMNYAFKVVAAILSTPLIYIGHFLIDRYIGEEAEDLKNKAHNYSK